MSLFRKKTKSRRIIIWIVSILIIIGVGFWRVSEPEVPKSIEFDDISSINQGTEHRVGLSLPISVDDPGMKEAGATWYFNWSHKPHDGVDLEFVPLVWGYPGNKRISEDYLNEVEQTIRENPEHYPDGTLFLVGNEIGYKDQKDGRTPEEYAKDFHTAFTILKSINPTYQVSVGPTVLNVESIITNSIVDAEDGLDYLSKVINYYQELYNEPIPAEYFAATNHVLDGSEVGLETFKRQIRDLRHLLHQNDLSDRNVILTEFGVPVRGLTAEEIADVMVETMSFVAEASDNEIGHPDDNGRLVQRWAWFTTRPMTSIDKVRHLGWSSFVLQLAPTSLYDLEGNPTYLHKLHTEMLQSKQDEPR